MEFRKTMTTMRHRIAGQLDKRLKTIDLDSLLGAAGLQVIKRAPGMALPLLAAFAGGVAIGAIFSPTSGKELRAGIGKLIDNAKSGLAAKRADRGPEVAHDLADGANGEAAYSPYDRAHKAAQRDQSGVNGQKKGALPPEQPIES